MSAIETETEKDVTDPQKATLKSERHDVFEKVTLATAIVGVIILCIYTGLTGYQAYIAKDTAERQLRAYVSVAVEKQPDLDGPGTPEVVFVMKNNGQTPAYNVDSRVSIFTGGDTLTEADVASAHAFLAGLAESRSPLFPGQEFRTSTVPGTGIPLSSQQRIAVSMGAQFLWAMGVVTYTDAFGYRRFTNFRLLMGGAGGAAPYHKFIWAADGNDAN